MVCENFRVRSKKYKKYCFCILKKEEISFETCKSCSCCKYKEYKTLKKYPIKKKSSKSSNRAKATDISQKTKQIVWDRDSHKCIYCGQVVSKSCANAHFIKRSQGGLGIPENIVTLCPDCHSKEDNGLETTLYEEYIGNYLKSIYGSNWHIQNLIYKKNYAARLNINS